VGRLVLELFLHPLAVTDVAAGDYAAAVDEIGHGDAADAVLLERLARIQADRVAERLLRERQGRGVLLLVVQAEDDETLVAIPPVQRFEVRSLRTAGTSP
jgi:hypothetical protein